MKINSRMAALVAGLVSITMLAVLRQPFSSDVGVAAASLDPSSFLHDYAVEAVHPYGEGDATIKSPVQASGAQGQDTVPAQWQAIEDHNNASRGPVQPIPFNHRFHVSDLQIDCMYCHTGTERSISGVVPPLEVCMGCHRLAGTGLPPVEELREYDARSEPIPWKWVNKLPEFVQFSHQAHLRNGLDCAECHGPVEDMDRVYQWASFEMGWCLECHRRSPVDTDVATDHILAQTVSISEPESDRQPGSFYPRAINTDYGATRAPTDCAACHY